MKLCTVIKTLVVITLLALDWAALHDIFKGLEPDYTLEYFALIASVIILVLLGIHSYLDKKAKKDGVSK